MDKAPGGSDLFNIERQKLPHPQVMDADKKRHCMINYKKGDIILRPPYPVTRTFLSFNEVITAELSALSSKKRLDRIDSDMLKQRISL